MKKYSRRIFVKNSLLTGAGLAMAPLWVAGCESKSGNGDGSDGADSTATAAAASAGNLFFSISLAEWSLHKAIREEKSMTNLDFPGVAKNDFGIDAVEYVSQLFEDLEAGQDYLNQLKQRCDDNGVTSVLIMVDNEGGLGTLDEAERMTAVENHYKWVNAAKFLGCHSIRVNAYGEGTADEVMASAVDGLGRLGEYAAQENINVIVENHGGHSSNGEWLASVMQQVGMDNVGTLPDFGNFCIRRNPDDWTKCEEEFDRYRGTELLMPYAKGVSAKTHDFNEQGEEVHTDYLRIMKIVKDAGYTGHVGIEYEGQEMSEHEGIRATKALLERVGVELS